MVFGSHGISSFLDLWLQWLKDESLLVSIPAAALELKDLYEKAVEDYLCEQFYSHTKFM